MNYPFGLFSGNEMQNKATPSWLLESVVALYIGMPRKQNGHPYIVIISELTNKQDLTYSEVVSDDFLADLSVYCFEIMLIK